jgi:hypothetical protein
VNASYDGSSIRVKSYGMGDFAGFVVLPPGAAPIGRPIIDGLCWVTPANLGAHAGR